jgi:hypothetical protein
MNTIHKEASAAAFSLFGGLQVIAAMDPLQNPLIKTNCDKCEKKMKEFYKDEMPCYNSPLFYESFNVGLLMNPDENQRFAEAKVKSWNLLLNKIRNLTFFSASTETVPLVNDVVKYHSMLGGILSMDNCTFPSKHQLVTIMDCANAIAMYPRMNRVFDSGETLQEWMQVEGYLLDSRNGRLKDILLALETRLNKPKTLADIDILNEFRTRTDKAFEENDLFFMTVLDESGATMKKPMQIVVTERKQQEAYEFILTSLLDKNYNIGAIDQYEDKNGLADMEKIPAATYVELFNQMNEEGLKPTVNLKPGSIRCISDNSAGSYLTSGQTVEIVNYDKDTDELKVRPFDVTGRGYHYPEISLKRIKREVECHGIKLTRSQFPIRSGCAMVVNSMAGLTYHNTALVYDNSG